MNAVDLIVALGRWGQQHPTELIVGMVAAPVVLGTASVLLRRGRTASTTHGSARWATPREVKRAGLYGEDGVVLGRLKGRVLCDEGETHVLLIAPTRCHARGTQILMADGQVRAIEDLHVGAQVMGPDSQPRTVLETHNGIAEMVTIQPVKGEPFTVTLDHVLSLQRTNPGKKSWRRAGELVDISVREWLTKSHTYRWQHKLYRVGVTFPAARPLPLDPYLLGVLLGDGSFGHESVVMTNPDLEIRGEVNRICTEIGVPVKDAGVSGGGCPRYKIAANGLQQNLVMRVLQSLGLKGRTAGSKFVPLSYKTASRQDRLQILAGLLDTDGSYATGGYDFISKSETLTSDVTFLARSLGFAAYNHPCRKTWQNGVDTYFRADVSGDLSEIPCRVKRKQAAVRQRKNSVLRTGFTVIPAGMQEYYGFTCDGDQRYLMGDFTVTHNSGKGIGVIIPTLLTWPASTIVLDPKDGENYDVTARWRASVARNRIAYFTPCRMPHTCINVLDSIRLKTPQEFGDAYTIAQSLTAPEKLAKESATSLHFRELAAFLLTAAELHVCYSGGHASLAAVWAFLTQFHDSLHDCLQVMQTTAHTSHGGHQAIISLTSAIRNITGDRELGSVWSTAIRPLVLYNDPLVAASTDTSTFDLEALQYGAEPLSLYMVAPSPRALERLHPLYRVVLDVAMARLMDHKVRTWQHRLLLCADELPAHGYIHALDKGAADMAGYGMKGLFIAQDIKQLEDVYGEEPVLWGNTDIKVFHAPTNDLTAHRIAEKLMGESTVSNPVEQHQGGLLGRRSTSYQHVGRSLRTHDEVMELDPRFEIIRRTGLKPILAEKIDYRTDPAFQVRVI